MPRQTSATATPKTFTVIYRTGGTANAQWKRVLERFSTREAAQACKAEVERTGRKALIHDTAQLERLGMPEGYAP